MKIWSKFFGRKINETVTELSQNINQVVAQKLDTKSERKIFLVGLEVEFNGNDQCEAFLQIQCSTETNAKTEYAGIELIFEEDKLVRAIDYREGNAYERKLKQNEIGLPFKEYRMNPILKFFDNQDGLHQLGGKLPSAVEFPENNCIVPFQYLGYISIEDENFIWLPGTVHLMCPIFLNIDMVYLDYSDLNKPSIINREEVEQYATSYDDLNQESEIVFHSRRFDLIPSDSIEPPMHSGLPSWFQYPTFPKCPKSGRTMRFLCQIHEGVDASFSNVIPKKESYRKYYEKLNFWGDGDLYVFIEPEAKTVCYFIQNT